MDISIKDYEPKFKPLIFELFKSTFKKDMSESFWNWKFENNPFGKPIIKLAFDNEKLVGNYLVNPLKIFFKNKFLPVLHSTTTMTHPDYSGMGISSNLAKQVFQLGTKLGYHAIIGFANNTSHNMFVNKLGFSDIEQIHEIYFTNSDFPSSKYQVEKISNFNEIPEKFCFMMQTSLEKFSIMRNNSYLNWRFKMNPEIEYSCFKIMNENEFLGYFVLKIFNETKCHIVDFLIKNDPECYKTMLIFSQSFSKINNLNSLTFWTNYQYFLNLLNKNSIKIFSQETFFIIKILKDGNNLLENFNNWNLTMSDSDVY